MSMALPAIIVGVVLGIMIGPFGILLFAPLITGGIILFILIPPLRSLGIALVALSIGLAVGMLISFLIVGAVLFGGL